MTVAATAASTVGVLLVGHARIAIPLDVLREVLPCPLELETLPASGIGTGLLGAVNLRGTVLPVLDLRPILGWDAPRASEQVITVISHADRMIGLVCDEVLGVSRLDGAPVQRLIGAPGSNLLFTHSFERPEDRQIVSVLDIEQIFGLPGIPAAQGATVPASTEVDGAVTATLAGQQSAHDMVLMRCGSIRFALDVGHIHALLPSVHLDDSPLTGGLCLGVTTYGQRSIPAIDPLRMLGMGSLDPDDITGGLILRFSGQNGRTGQPDQAGGPSDDGFVALLLSEVIEIMNVQDGGLLQLPATMAASARWFQGLATTSAIGDFLVLDPPRLTGDRGLATFASLNTGTGGSPLPAQGSSGHDAGNDPTGTRTAAARTGADRAGGRYLTYDVGVEVATPLLQVSEIIPCPQTSTPMSTAEPAMLSVFTHHGTVVPLICLPTLLGHPPESDLRAGRETRVMIVAVDGGTVGFLVNGLCSIETSTWEETDQDETTGGSSVPSGPDNGLDDDWDDLGDEPLPAARAAARSRIIRIGAEAQDRHLRTLDLAAIARTLTTWPDPPTDVAHPLDTRPESLRA